MANVDAPHGFISIGARDGRPGYFRNFNHAVADTTAIGFNDLVQPTAAGVDAAQAVAGGPVLGISHANGAASTLYVVPVELITSDLVMEAQTNTSLAAADTGLNADVVVAARNATTGISNMEINGDSEATTATLDLRLLRLAPYVGNAAGTNSRWFVLCNDVAQEDLKAGE